MGNVLLSLPMDVAVYYYGVDITNNNKPNIYIKNTLNRTRLLCCQDIKHIIKQS